MVSLSSGFGRAHTACVACLAVRQLYLGLSRSWGTLGYGCIPRATKTAIQPLHGRLFHLLAYQDHIVADIRRSNPPHVQPTHPACSAYGACLIHTVHIINNMRCTQPHVLMYASMAPRQQHGAHWPRPCSSPIGMQRGAKHTITTCPSACRSSLRKMILVIACFVSIWGIFVGPVFLCEAEPGFYACCSFAACGVVS